VSKLKQTNNKGQVIIEAVLLLTLVVGMWGLFSKYAKQKKWFESLVNGPWQTMSGMIETGVWETPNKARAKHPNSFNRVVSLKE
jgi:hypothetical protein